MQLIRNFCQQGDVGVVFTITIVDDNGAVIDISSFTDFKMKFELPDRSTQSFTATLVTTGEDGKITYTTETGLFDLIGVYKVQGWVSDGSQIFSTREAEFVVLESIAEPEETPT